jgi:hypothetical protein
MSEHRKTIQVNPDLFKITDKGKTQKKRESKKTPKIKIKPDTKPFNNTIKNKYLKYIREKQQKDYDKLFNETQKKYSSLSSIADSRITNDNERSSFVITDIVSTPSQPNNFAESVEYLQNISDKTNNDDSLKKHRSTISNRPISDTEYFHSILPNTDHSVIPYPPKYKEEFDKTATLDKSIFEIDPQTIVVANFPENDRRSSQENCIKIKPSLSKFPMPKYGCLKNGKLPTYRKYMNKTQNSYNNFPSQATENWSSPSLRSGEKMNITSSSHDTSTPPSSQKDVLEKQIEFKNKMLEKIKNKQTNALITAKRKKTIKRTFIIGRSNVYSKIGVLIKNRTIRNRIITQRQLLKQVKIDDIKTYLIRNGLIKVGTPAPNDVLRQIYESAIMIGGEVRNYNVESLLHNYLNS